MIRKYLAVLILAAGLAGCNVAGKNRDPNRKLDSIAEQYVRLGLDIGQYDPDFVDAYYGPDSLRPSGKLDSLPKGLLLSKVDSLKSLLKDLTNDENDSLRIRAQSIDRQLTAYARRIRIFTGEYAAFDLESEELFGVKAPSYTAAHFQTIIDSLDTLLPGQGSIQHRFQLLADRFIIPRAKLDTVFRTTIAEARKRTLKHFTLPEKESFTLEYVTDKSWSGYNWYKGNYNSLIQINTDTHIFLERAIDVGSHESYPGHHVYNMLLEKNLYHDKGWVETSLYPLFSPQSFIAEGSANYGIDLAFPGDQKTEFAKNVLLPLSGLDTAGVSLYFRALALKGKLNYARNEAARGLLSGAMDEKQAVEWLQKYCLFNEETALKSVGFIKKYRSYVINYNYGQDLIRQYIEQKASRDTERWQHFETILKQPIDPAKLTNTHREEN